MKRAFIISISTLIFLSPLLGTNYFVANNGNDSNSGSITLPFATIMQAQQFAEAGDTVFVRGGLYKLNNQHISTTQKIWAIVNPLNKSGKAEKRICYFAYKNEKPIFDMSQVKPENKRIIAFDVTGSWIHIKGIEVIGTQVTIKNHTQSENFHNEGSHNIFEQLSMHDSQAIGFYLSKGSDNLILNCDAYNNYDYTSENGKGGNSDGFGCHPQQGGTGNIFRACRAWFNSDDGFDLIRANEAVVIENCWAFYNGYSTKFEALADGNGFKAGGWGLQRDKRVPDSIPMHTIQFCLAVNNRANGFYANHHPGGNYWYNNTAYQNGTNYNMLNRNKEFTQDVAGYNHILINNLSYAARSFDTQNIDSSLCTQITNSFSMQIRVRKTDFKSTDQSQLTAARKADGSLPDIDFLHLKKGSKLIDKGSKIGFPYNNKCPDLGAFEY